MVGCGVFFDGRGCIFIWSRVRVGQPARPHVQKVIFCLVFSMFLRRSCWYQAGNREDKYAESVILLSIFKDLGGGG